jgi:hypothetical protein
MILREWPKAYRSDFSMINALRTPANFLLRTAWLTVFSCSATAAQSQERAVRDTPRSVEVFARSPDYTTFSADRYGTPGTPFADELGFWLVVQMFRSVCLGIETGASVDAVLPEGFSAHNFAPYFFGPDTPPNGDVVVLSSTGDIELDEDGGHPAIWLEPDPAGMTCKAAWILAEPLSPESQTAIANLITQWMPWALTLVPASRPTASNEHAINDGIEWDRPCQDKWCPATAFYSLPSGNITLQMTLNITGIEGERP